MYENLIETLRFCAKNGDCHDCPYEKPCAGTMGDGLYCEAADAIEELQNTYDTVTSVQKHVIENLRNDLDFAIRAEAAAVKACTPRWIPVTERLPDDRRDVQITVFWHDAWRTMYGYYDGAFWHLYAPMHTEVSDVEVIGWMEKPAPMPLPEPPKEET